MNHSRRLVSYAAAAIAGLAATFVISSPASAHLPHINTTSITCDKMTGDRLITWAVNGTSPGTSTTWQLNTITFTPAPPTSVITGDLATTGVAKPVDFVFTGIQRVPGSTSSVSLAVVAHWSDGTTTDTSKPVNLSTYPGCTPQPVVTSKSNCDGTITITLDNSNGNAPATFTVSSEQNPIVVPGGQKKDVTAAGDKDVTVTVQGVDGRTVIKFKQPDNCPTPTPSPSPTLPTTGNHLTTVIGVGVGLLVVGIGLIASLFLFRRRRTVAGG